MSRFPKLTETFVLLEMQAMEAAGARIQLFPLRLERATKIHPEAVPWLQRGDFEPLLSWSVVRANIETAARRPFRYVGTLLLLLSYTFGSLRYFAGSLAFFPKSVWLAKQMKFSGVEHVHAHFASHPTAVAWVIQRLSGIPYSFTAHGSDLHRERNMLRQKVEAATFVVAISDFNRSVILDECGDAAHDKVTVIHCGVDLGFFKPVEKSDSSRSPAIVCVGTLHEVKGQRYLIEACRRLAGRGLAFDCSFVGTGPDHAALARQVEVAGLGSRVRFLGSMTREEVRDRLAQADIVVAPSVPTRDGRREGIPVALMEAMASGTAIVASRLSGIPELVQDGVSGLLVEPRDVDGLAVALERLLEDRDLRRRLATAARAKVEQEFDLQGSAAALLDCLVRGEEHDRAGARAGS